MSDNQANTSLQDDPEFKVNFSTALKLCKNEEEVKQLMAKITGDISRTRNAITKPEGWKNIPPYYSEKFALPIKKIVDDMIIDHKPRELRYSDFAVTKTSLKARVFQGFLYLVNKMDTADRTYAKARLMITIEARQTGIRLTLDPHKKVSLLPNDKGTMVEVDLPSHVVETVEEEKVEVVEDTFKSKVFTVLRPFAWRAELEDFLRPDSAVPAFKRAELKLKPEEVVEVTGILSALLPKIKFKVEESRILIVRVSTELRTQIEGAASATATT